MKHKSFIAIAFVFFACMFSLHMHSSTLYWVGGTGKWTDPAHWSATSGGSGGAGYPTQSDIVIFNNHSFTAATDSLVLDTTLPVCQTMQWNSNVQHGITVWNNMRTTDSLAIYGNLILRSFINWQYAGFLSFKSNTSGNTIHSHGLTIPGDVIFNGSGSWQLLSAFRCKNITFVKGNLFTMGKNLTCRDFNAIETNIIALHFGSSTIRCHQYYLLGPNITVDADSCVIRAQFFYSFLSANYNKIKIEFSPEFPDGNDYCVFSGSGSGSTWSGSGINIGTINEVVAKNPTYSALYDFEIIDAKFKSDFRISEVLFVSFGMLDCRANFATFSSFSAGTFKLKAGNSATFYSGTTATLNNFIITASGCGAYTTIRSSDPFSQAIISVPTGTINCDYLILNGINATGGATFNASNSIIISNTSGWNILSTPTTPRTLYWVGGTGYWNQCSHWSSTSGGLGGAGVPNMLDDVIFDNSSFLTSNDTIKVENRYSYCHNMSWQMNSNPVLYKSGFETHGFEMGNDDMEFNVYGDLALDTGLIWQYNGKLIFRGNGDKTIRDELVHIGHVFFESDSSSWTLADSLSCENIQLNSGYFNTANFNVNCFYVFQLSDSSQLGTSLIHCSIFNNNANASEFDGDSAVIACGFFTGQDQHYKKLILERSPFPEFIGTNCTINEISSHGHLQFYFSSGNSFGHAVFYDFAGVSGPDNSFDEALFQGEAYIIGNTTFGTAEFNGDLHLLDDNTFDVLRLNNPGHDVYFDVSPYSQTVNASFEINSDSLGLVNLHSMSTTPADLNIQQYAVCMDYITMEYINSSGPTLFYAGTHSIDNGNNSNINFISCDSSINSIPRILYWVNGTGNWNDSTHWSLTSGGTAGENAPNYNDDLFFDANSFFTANDTVNLNHLSGRCHNMTWQITSNPVIYDDPTDYTLRNLTIYGNLTLDTGITWAYPRALVLAGSGATNTITTANVILKEVDFNSNLSSWIMHDSISCDSFHLKNGSLNTAGHNIICSYRCEFESAIQLHQSKVRTLYFVNTATDIQFDGDSSIIECSYFEGYDEHYNVVWMGNASALQFSGQNCTIRDYTSNNDLTFIATSNNTFGSAKFLGTTEISGHANFGTAEFNGDATLMGNNSFDTLKFYNAGYNIIIETDSTQAVNFSLFVNSDAFSSISFNSTSGGDGNLTCYQDTVCIDYLTMQYINANGPAIFYAGVNSTDNGNNTNINFTECGSTFSLRSMDESAQNQDQNQLQIIPVDLQLYPNPTNENTTLIYSMPIDGNVLIEVFDITGKCIYLEEKRSLSAGNYSESLFTNGWTSGIYNCRITTDTQVKSIRLIKAE